MENPETRDGAHQEAAPPLRPAPELPQKTPVLAAILSVIPGLGNIYNGLYRRGVVFFLVYVSLFTLAINSDEQERPFLIPCVVFVFFFNVFDAYRQATLINYGYRLGSDEAAEGRPGLGGWGLAPGVFLLALGAYGLLRKYFNIDLSWVIDQWPFALMGVGAWMIYQYFRERKQGERGTVV